ncbi:Uncharacterised protein [uncultured archaeon]|nr:Uncharacterised protein [uncultured archaeon]
MFEKCLKLKRGSLQNESESIWDNSLNIAWYCVETFGQVIFLLYSKAFFSMLCLSSGLSRSIIAALAKSSGTLLATIRPLPFSRTSRL